MSVYVSEEDPWGAEGPQNAGPPPRRGARMLDTWGAESYRMAVALAVVFLASGVAFAALTPNQLYWQRAMSFALLGLLPGMLAFAAGYLMFWAFKGASLSYDPIARMMDPRLRRARAILKQSCQVASRSTAKLSGWVARKVIVLRHLCG